MYGKVIRKMQRSKNYENERFSRNFKFLIFSYQRSIGSYVKNLWFDFFGIFQLNLFQSLFI